MTGRDPLVLDARVPGGPDHFRFATADGLHSPDAFRPATRLLLDHLWGRGVDHLVCPAANYGVLGTVLAHDAGRVTMTESSARAARFCRRNVRENDATDAAVELVPRVAAVDDTFDAAAYAPKPYAPLAVGKQRLADALAALEPGGRLYVAADRQAGLARYEDCLRDLAGGVEEIDARDDCRLLAAERSKDLDVPTYEREQIHEATVDGVDLDLVTRPGLFAAGGLDHGTRLLLEHAAVDDGDRVLDACCGYGPVGAWAASAADCDVWLTDDDRRATACAERTLARNDLAGTVVTADGTRGVADERFDRVLANPPTHAGDAVLADLFAGVRDVLRPGGHVTLVHHRALDLSRHLGGFAAVERVATGDEHVVVRASAGGGVPDGGPARRRGTD